MPYKFKDEIYIKCINKSFSNVWYEIGKIYKVFISVGPAHERFPYISVDNIRGERSGIWYIYEQFERDFNFTCPHQEFETIETRLP